MRGGQEKFLPKWTFLRGGQGYCLEKGPFLRGVKHNFFKKVPILGEVRQFSFRKNNIFVALGGVEWEVQSFRGGYIDWAGKEFEGPPPWTCLWQLP